MRLLINGLSMGGGGGLTVGRYLTEFVARHHPNWQIDLEVIAGHRLHEELSGARFPDNVAVRKAPSATLERRHRAAYERGPLAKRAASDGTGVVLQLNGMVVPGMSPPTVAHFQDPWPYRPEAWTRPCDRLVAALKRSAHRRSLRSCAAATWTSGYLERLVCTHAGRTPPISAVVYNGVPPKWLERTAEDLIPWDQRSLQITTISNVTAYKRQSLVIEAMGLLKRAGHLPGLEYRVGGQGSADVMAGLRKLAEACGVADEVHLEGRISDERVCELFRGSRAFVLMSVCESFGIPAVEAMTFGTPVVVADCCAIPEVCGSAGRVVPVDDAGSLADNLRAVLEEPGCGDAMSILGIERAQDFSWTAVAERMSAVLNRVATSRSVE